MTDKYFQMEIQVKGSLIPDRIFLFYFFKMVSLFIANYLFPYTIRPNYYLYVCLALNHFPDLVNVPLFFKTQVATICFVFGFATHVPSTSV